MSEWRKKLQPVNSHPLLSRRSFCTQAALATSGVLLSRRASAAQAPIYNWRSNTKDYFDPDTGAYVRSVTDTGAKDTIVYQTHPQWVGGMEYLLFDSDRAGERLPYVRQMASGVIRPLAEEPIGPWVLRPSTGEVFFVHDRRVYVQPVVSTFQKYRKPRRIVSLNRTIESLSGGLSFDANGRLLYAGVKFHGAGRWGIMALDVRLNQWKVVTEVAFQVGHVQAHPAASGTVMFCHETGGDAPQRTWIVRSGDPESMPFYKEWYGEWVTHEVWWGDHRALFTIWPYDDERLKALHGIVSVDLYGNDLRPHCRYKAWHCHGSPNGKWIVGDDFDGNLWLIGSGSYERRLLTGGHRGEGFDTHPHASFTPDSRAVVFNSSRFGQEDIMVVEIPPWDSLPKESAD